MHHFPAHNFKIIYVCLGFVFKATPLYVTFSQCKNLYTCKSRRGAFYLQLSALSWDAASPHWVLLIMMLGGLRGLCHVATLLLLHYDARLWIRLHESIWLCLSSYCIPPAGFGLADWATSFTLSKLPLKKATGLFYCSKIYQDHFLHRFFGGENVYYFQDNKDTTNIFILKLQNQRKCIFYRNSGVKCQVLRRGKHSGEQL